MKRKNLKSLSIVLALTLAMSAFTGCGSSSTSESSESAESAAASTTSSDTSASDSEQYASYWTEEQKNTIDSMTQIDDEGYLYEMNYTADYDLDDLIKAGTSSAQEEKDTFQKLYLPDSEFETPTKIYGACSAFATKDADGKQILGRNYDWNKEEEVGAVVHTAPANGYKSIGVADLGFLGIAKGFNTIEQKENALYAPLYVVDGLNEKGLACTVLVLEEDSSKQETDKEAVASGMVVRLLLDKADTVENAQKVLEQYDIVSSMYATREQDEYGGSDFHWLVTDKNGDSALFEIVDNKLVVNKTPVVVNGDVEGYDTMSTADINKNIKIDYPEKDLGYMLATNFYVTPGYQNTNGEGYWRYQTLSKELADNPNPTTDEALDYLKSVKYFQNDVDYLVDLKSQGKDPDQDENWEWLTVWSEVYNTDDMTLTLCLRENYDTKYTFNIEK